MAEVLAQKAAGAELTTKQVTEKPFDVRGVTDPNSFYQRMFSPDSIESQIVRLCEMLGINWPNLKKINTSLSFPEDDVSGFAVVLDYKTLSEDYGMAIQKMLNLIFKKGTRIQNELQGKLIKKMMIDPFTKMCLDMCQPEKNQALGPFKIFPINTGHKWTKKTALETKRQLMEKAAQDEGEWIEFPITSFDCLCLFASHSERMIQRDSILPICAGDIVGPNEKNESSFVSAIDFDDAGRKFKSVYNQMAYSGREFGHHATWTGFVLRDNKPS